MKEFEEAFSLPIPSIGRIDVANSMFMVDYLGTGWLIDKDVVVTNRHVAELVAARDGGRFLFRPGRNGIKPAYPSISSTRWTKPVRPPSRWNA